MKFLKITAFLAIIAFCAWALWTGQQSPRPTVIAAVPTAECAAQHLPAEYHALGSALREFDDALNLAISVPRDMVIAQVEQLQRVRREVEAAQVPACLEAYRASVVRYMNRVVDLLVAFVAGAAPSQISDALFGATDLRQEIFAEITLLTGISPTPYPTAVPLASATPEAGVGIPVTGAPQAALALVTHADGVNLREGPGVNYTFYIVVGAGSQLPVLGVDASRQWLKVQVNEQEGWVFLPLVELNLPVESLLVLE
ncbi:MAG: SH3 domain-containing protein [Anaerolineales bacterium]|nr:SH3 domain-containing protein [Anaerolineales bacterium]